MAYIQSVAVLVPLLATSNWALIFLLSKRSGNPARYFLGLFMLVASLLYMGHAFYFMKWFRWYVHYEPVYTLTSLVVFPLYYQYLRLLTVDREWRRTYLFHYIPGVVMGLVAIVLHILFHEEAHNYPFEHFVNKSGMPGLQVNPVLCFDIFRRILYGCQVLFYLWAGIKMVSAYQERVDHFYSNSAVRSINWVKALNFSLLVAAALSMIFNVAGRNMFLDKPSLMMIPSILFSLLFFVLGYLGNSQNQVVIEMPEKVQSVVLTGDSATGDANPAGGTGMENEFGLKLRDLFVKERLFLNPDLIIWDVTRALGTNRSYVSHYINSVYGKNFSMYVNQYRVEEAKKLLAGEEGSRLSLETIGSLCGFGSLNNFIRVFRMFENTTPGSYRELCRKSEVVV